jgi:hypothetical protein
MSESGWSGYKDEQDRKKVKGRMCIWIKEADGFVALRYPEYPSHPDHPDSDNV